MQHRPPGDPLYRSQVDPITSDKRGRIIPRTALNLRQLKLDNATSQFPLRIDGDFLYADADSTGRVGIQFNDSQGPSMPFVALSAMDSWPYEDIYASWTAQPGKVLNLWWGYGARFRPPLNSSLVAAGSTPIQLSGAGGINQVPQLMDLQQDQFGYFGVVSAAANAGAVSWVGVYSPLPGGTNRLYVDAVWIKTSVADAGLQLSYGTLLGGAPGAAGAQPNIKPKRQTGSGAVGNSLLRQGTVALAGLQNCDLFNLAANGSEYRVYGFPPFGGSSMVVDVDCGLFFTSSAINTALTAVFHCREYF